jgi:hypothetical protein
MRSLCEIESVTLVNCFRSLSSLRLGPVMVGSSFAPPAHDLIPVNGPDCRRHPMYGISPGTPAWPVISPVSSSTSISKSSRSAIAVPPHRR